MYKIGRRIFFDKVNGDLILDKGEIISINPSFDVEYDFNSYKVLKERVRETVDFIDLEFGQYAQDFAQCDGYRVNSETKQLEFSYPDPNGTEDTEPVYQKPLSEEVEELKKEKTLLKAQNQALTERTDFHEELIAEMAMTVYS